MDFNYAPEEERFRLEARTWIRANLPEGWGRTVHESADEHERYAFRLEWEKRIFAGGWAGLAWPREYGGRGATLVEQAIFAEELASAGAPEGLNIIGRNLTAPTLIHHGTEAQRRRFLPKILSCEEVWCQGFSEPNAGSDLAAVRTTAVRDGDHFVVDGQKTWTSFA
jgi:alkylation response protein AidB-like acyl-CoA dehydrogenase